jgi:hypothetical protein
VQEEEDKTPGLFLVEKQAKKTNSLVIPGESAEEFEALERGLLQEYQPVGATETLIVKDLAKFHWLKERAIRYEARAEPGAKGLATLADYRRTNERAFSSALKVLLGLQKQRKSAEAKRPRLVER